MYRLHNCFLIMVEMIVQARRGSMRRSIQRTRRLGIRLQENAEKIAPRAHDDVGKAELSNVVRPPIEFGPPIDEDRGKSIMLERRNEIGQREAVEPVLPVRAGPAFFAAE